MADKLKIGGPLTPSMGPGETFSGEYFANSGAKAVEVLVRKFKEEPFGRRFTGQSVYDRYRHAAELEPKLRGCRNVVPILHVEKSAGDVYIASAALHTVRLDQLLATRKRAAQAGVQLDTPQRFWVYVGIEACQALSEAHACEPEILHGNLNASSILLGLDGRVFVTDFGLAKERPDGPAADVRAVALVLCDLLQIDPSEVSKADLDPSTPEAVLARALGGDPSMRTPLFFFIDELQGVLDAKQSWEPGADIVAFVARRGRQLETLLASAPPAALLSASLRNLQEEEQDFFARRRELAASKREVKAAREKLDTQQTRANMFDTQVTDLKRIVQEKLARIMNLEHDVQVAEARGGQGHDQTKKLLVQAIQNLQAERTEKSVLEGRVNSLFQEIAALKQTVSLREIEAAEARNSLSTLEKRSSELLDQAKEHYQWELESARTKLSAQQEGLADLRSELERVVSSRDAALLAAEQQYADTLHQLVDEKARLDAEVARLREENEQLGSAKSAADEQLSEVREQLREAREQLSEARERLRAASVPAAAREGLSVAPPSTIPSKRAVQAAKQSQHGNAAELYGGPTYDDQGRHTADLTIELTGLRGAVRVRTPYESDPFEAELKTPDPALLESVLAALRDGGTAQSLRSAFQRLGAELFEMLTCAPSVQAAYRQHLRRTGPKLLRFMLRFMPRARANDARPEDWPWEFAWDSSEDRYLGLESCFVLRRQLGVPDADESPSAISSPCLRVLFAIAAPTLHLDAQQREQALDRIDTEAARRIFAQLSGERGYALEGAGGIQIVPTPLSRASFQDALRSPHEVFHFHGHGSSGKLFFEGKNQFADEVDSPFLRSSFSGHAPSVAVLNCCHGLSNDGSCASVARALIEAGVRNVVAMQGKVHDATANEFSQRLYVALAAGTPLEEAVQGARLFISKNAPGQALLPVLFQQSSSSVRFELRGPKRSDIRELDRELNARLPEAYVSWMCARGEDELPQEVLPTDAAASRDIARRAFAEFSNQLSDELAPADLVQLARDSARHQIDEDTKRRNSMTNSGAQLLTKLSNLEESLSGLARQLAPKVPKAPKQRGIATLRGADWDKTTRLGSKTNDEILASARRICNDLVLDEQLVIRAMLHLISGHHLILAGPPGTGKTTLAQRLAAELGYDVHVTTATPEWTSFDLVTGLIPSVSEREDGKQDIHYEMQPGHLVQAVLANWNWETPERWQRAEVPPFLGKWLIIDEFNRAPMDKAFADLFTALERLRLRVTVLGKGGTEGSDEIPIPPDFRIIGTINTFDRDLLFQLSDALKRRFAFVEVGVYDGAGDGARDRKRNAIRTQVSERARSRGHQAFDGGHPRFEQVYERLDAIVSRIRGVQTLGQAQIVDAISFAMTMENFYDVEEAIDEALVSYVLPQVENLSRIELMLLIGYLTGERLMLAVEQALYPDQFSRPNSRLLQTVRQVLLACLRLPPRLGTGRPEQQQDASDALGILEGDDWQHRLTGEHADLVRRLGVARFESVLDGDARFVQELARRVHVAL